MEGGKKERERGEGVPCSGVLGPLGFISVFTLPGHMLHNK